MKYIKYFENVKSFSLSEPIAVVDERSNYQYMNAKRVTVYDDSLKIDCTSMGESIVLIINEDSMSIILDGDYKLKCFFLGYYSKAMSKYYRYIEYSETLYNIIKRYLPGFKCVLVNIELLESIGWSMSNNNDYRLYNIVVFDKGVKKLLFNFDTNVAKVYVGNNLIEEIKVILESDLERLKQK